ncbi:MAG: hypothetical protein JW709_01325 [Sedimentisphaerales bacterium]|nr:hypothetical protein [Sedimentisphaerales bacterium]
MELIKQLRNKIREEKSVFGTFLVELKAVGVAYALADSGLDFIMLDGEHGCYSMSEMGVLIDAAKHAGICPFVRIDCKDRAKITQALDAGAEGIIFPQIQTLDDVRLAVEATKYQPMGRRGVHMLRPHTRFNPPGDKLEYFEQANRNLMTVIQIETRQAVEIIDEIASTNGVDMLYVGPDDLSVELGCPGDSQHYEMKKIIAKVGESCRRHGKVAGRHISQLELLSEMMNMGYRFFGYAATLRILMEGAQALCQRIKLNLSQKENIG